MNRIKLLTTCAVIAVLQASVVQAQLTWDAVAGDGVVTHSNGVWDTSTANWTSDDGVNNTTWVNGSDAVFTKNASNTVATVSVDSGITVGNLTVSPTNGNGQVTLAGLLDNTQLTVKSGGATWALGGRILEILGNQANDLGLTMTSGDTLTITEGGGTGGTFDAGEKANGADWGVAGCTLDFQVPGTLKGHVANVGKFDLVKMVGGSKYIHERNTDQGYANNWELGAGIVTFDNRYSRNLVMNGVISGAGTLKAQNLGTRLLKLVNTNNTFSGGIVVDSAANRTEIQNFSGSDAAFGAVPGTFDPDNITLMNMGELKVQNITINPNRGITLDNGGIIINNGGATVYDGTITGTGPLQVGRASGSDGNTLLLTSNTHDYTGGTHIWQGSITMGIDNAIPTNSLLTIGGTGSSRLYMNGYDQTIAGLNTAGSNTREIKNDGGGTNATLTINVANGKNYTYGSAISGTDAIHLVKNGLGTQTISTSGFTTDPASLTINDGFMAWNAGEGPSGLTTVNSGGTLGGTGTLSSDAALNSGARIAPGNKGGHNKLKFLANLDLSAMIDDNAGGIEISFGGLDDQIVVTNAAANGTINMSNPSFDEFFDLGFADFTFIDTTGIADGVYTVMVADAVSGTLDPTDLSGPVGAKGATGTLSIDTGVVLLTVVAGNYTPYGEWLTKYGQDDGEADPDFDNYNNLQEYAFGGDPTNAAVQGHVPVSEVIVDGSTNWLTYAYGYRSDTNSGVTVTAETTGNLVIGTWTTAGVTVLGTNTIDGTYDTITNGIPMDGTTDFLGVFVEQTP
ncbi:autotransporter outer membrane beta-barrel domain-containing protein [Pontiella sulfatireligans]|uniref:Uncharacterized protein n=1 Tax=Pontiella sulfatireligans TaxID=2750658 RepID=A0A6C2UJ91_9BACT|nr:hypothetical protein [Pontiella sulfatireligans]VGO19384.1 hypothetical protein SCARR_01442 [Pontiella sulfatireligans]